MNRSSLISYLTAAVLAGAAFFGGRSLPHGGNDASQASGRRQDATPPAPAAAPGPKAAEKRLGAGDWEPLLDNILAAGEAIRDARLRELIRQLELEEISRCAAAAVSKQPSCLSACVEAWAEREAEAARDFLNASQANGKADAGAWESWMRGFSRTHAKEALAWMPQAPEALKKELWTGIAAGMSESDPRGAWLQVKGEPAFLAASAAMGGVIFSNWARRSPKEAIAAWAGWRQEELAAVKKFNETASSKKPEVAAADGCLQGLVDGLGAEPPETAAKLLGELAQITDVSGVAESLARRNPEWWLQHGFATDASAAVRSAAASLAESSPAWALAHADDLSGEARQEVVAAALNSSQWETEFPAPASKSLLDWVEELSPERRAALKSDLFQTGLRIDPARAMKLVMALPKQERNKAVLEGWMGLASTEPRLAEKMLTDVGNPDVARTMRAGFLVGVNGLWNSPHDAICRAASLADPEMRHRGFATALLVEEEAEPRAALVPWLKSMPEGTVDPKVLKASIRATFDEFMPVLSEQHEDAATRQAEVEKFTKRAAEVEKLLDESYPNPP